MVARELGEVIGRDNNESEGQAAPVIRSGRSKIKTWDRRTIDPELLGAAEVR